MLTLNAILKELKNVPEDRLEDLYSIIHSLRTNTKKTGKTSQKILSFAGSFGDMPENGYSDFLRQTKETRVRKNRQELSKIISYLLMQLQKESI